MKRNTKAKKIKIVRTRKVQNPVFKINRRPKKKFKINRTTRTKKNIFRTTIPKEGNKMTITKPFGGHIPFPPKNCPKLAFSFTHNDVTWIDGSICIDCPDKKTCLSRTLYLKQIKDRRKEHFNPTKKSK